METKLVHLACFALINSALLLAGFILIKRKLLLLSWLLLVVSIIAVHLVFINDGPIIRMLTLIATTFTAMKVIAVNQEYKNKVFALTFKQWFIFATAWAGMRAQPFETLGQKALPNAWPLIRFGISRVIFGAMLLMLAHVIVRLHLGANVTYIAISALALVGLSLILHFGLLSISAGMWRLSGVNIYLLFKQPAMALSLTEFWSKRWNLAFSEMTSVAIFRPLKSRAGAAAALMASFIFSGLLHEIALSVPINSGYGLPTLYFILQGSVVLFEKALIKNKNRLLQPKSVARVWTLFWVIAPMPLLFHTEFIKQVVLPLAALKL